MEPRIREWATKLADREVEAFLNARRRFRRKPSFKRLHGLRSSASRLCALYEDLSALLPARRLRRLRVLVKYAGAARDAVVTYRLLQEALDEGEREILAGLLRTIRRTARRQRARLLRMTIR